MTNYDFSPLFRSTIGFDRMMRLLEGRTRPAGPEAAYPPYDIETVDENHYRLTLAVAGFSEQDLDVETRENALTVRGRRGDDAAGIAYLHHGIAGRAFKRQFQIEDHVRVDGANLHNGLLTIDLVRELPEEMKPRRIDIQTAAPENLIAEDKAA